MRGREKYQCLKSQCVDCYSPLRIGLCNSRQNSPSFIFRPVIFSCRATEIAFSSYPQVQDCGPYREAAVGTFVRGNFGIEVINPGPSPTPGSTLSKWCKPGISTFSVAIVKRGSSPRSRVRRRKDTLHKRDRTARISAQWKTASLAGSARSGILGLG